METSKAATAKGDQVPRPPTSSTRLQKHAPASLQLDQIPHNAEGNAITNNTNFSCCVIPLLSPLILSPSPPPPRVEEKLFPDSGHCEQGGSGGGKHGGPASPGGWQHPALGTLTEPSTLLTFFQTRCVL